MTDLQKKELKLKIETGIYDLHQEIELIEVEDRFVAPDNAIGRLSRMEAISSKAISNAALHDKKTTMQRLEYALSSIESENFGICTRCNNEITYQRLLAIPYVTLCIKCAQRG